METKQLSYIINQTKLSEKQIHSVLHLHSEGATVPFMARYRKDVTGNLDEVQIQSILDSDEYIKDIFDRQHTIIKAVEEQGKLTDELKSKIINCLDKNELEDLYLPYKKKRKTLAQKAVENGLQPLADIIIEQKIEIGNIDDIAKTFIKEDGEVKTVQEAIDGATHIIIETISNNADLRKEIRKIIFETGSVISEQEKEITQEHQKFKDYFSYKESITSLSKSSNSHRYMALRRGEQEKAISVKIESDDEKILSLIERTSITNQKSIFVLLLKRAISTSYKAYIAPSIHNEVRSYLKEIADAEAIQVFCSNVQSVLLQSPLGPKTVLGLDPGFRTGCKVVVISPTGTLLCNTAIYPHPPQCNVKEAEAIIKALVIQYQVQAIAIGNGTAGRETDHFISQMIKDGKISKVTKVLVNESGASIYSASEIARKEFPDHDVTVRGSVSIARRLQDPLAELIKIDPKSIGVGQYQHDVNQSQLKKSLQAVVENCVNKVGVDINTASEPLLTYVSGIGPSLAKKIITYREQSGEFADRESIKNISGLSDKVYEQAAGFLRIRKGKNLLDNTGIHPETYSIVSFIAQNLNVEVSQLITNSILLEKAKKITPPDNVGKYTWNDIITELAKPGFDPREEFQEIGFRDDITKIEDVTPSMILQGVVTNVTNFGAFVDIGVHQDGLIHVSQIGDTFVSDPKKVLSVGQKVTVKILEVDVVRKRISLTMKMSEKVSPSNEKKKPDNFNQKTQLKPKQQFSNSPFAALNDKFKR